MRKLTLRRTLEKLGEALYYRGKQRAQAKEAADSVDYLYEKGVFSQQPRN